MLDRMKTILRENNMCVMATCRDNKPHCSLMAYITDPECRTIYMVSERNTQKWNNLVHNPHVSLMVDTRMNPGAVAGAAIQALTIDGIHRAVEDGAEKQSILREIEEAHPHVKRLTQSRDAEVVAVKIESFLLLDGVTDAHFEYA
jgi:nitroimidazol reductase NimA-like FMN-containing flavoprotein (pyridoxamine 5'-phosphate oxidase superfamily)